jgi:purine-binding chemotaxis protein CheW
VSRELLCFELGSDTYGVDLARVREIAPYEDLARMPSTPAFLCGLLPRQEAPVPVIDFARKFGLPATSDSRRRAVLVVETRIDGSPALMGVLLDASSRVVTLDQDALADVPELGAGLRVEYLQGVARVEGRLVLVVNLDRALSATELEALQGLAADHARLIDTPAGDVHVESGRASERREGPAPGGASEEYVVFAASGVKLGLALERVRELIQYGSVSPVPGARAWIRGVTNRRGQVTTVVDLAMCLGLKPAPATARTCLLILDLDVEGGSTEVGFVIDDILDVAALGVDQIDAAPGLGAPVSADRLRGVAQVGDDFVALLDAGQLLPSGIDGA